MNIELCRRCYGDKVEGTSRQFLYVCSRSKVPHGLPAFINNLLGNETQTLDGIVV